MKNVLAALEIVADLNAQDAGKPPAYLVYVLTFSIIVLLLLMIPVINKIFAHLSKSVENWCYEKLSLIRVKGFELALPQSVLHTLVGLVKYFRAFLVYGLLLMSGILVFNFFPATRAILVSLLDGLVEHFKTGWEAFLDFFPDMLALVLIFLGTHYFLKLLKFISDGIQKEKIKISGVHAELIDPTYQLLRFLVIAFALVAAFPYIPGSDSPVFKGVSIFVGFLLSLGSTSLVSNIISGVVLTYTRGLKVGDRVEIGNTIGDVVDRNLLVTRIRTIKNVVITIPNSMVLNNHIINYSSSVTDQGLILHTTVTIGYDVPWRQVHQLLIAAAHNTPGIQPLPRPFVFQTSLDDYYVSYELNAYTRNPSKMAEIYSRLHQNIQDEFAEARVEILSPAYAAYRNGNPSTIPARPTPVGEFSEFFQANNFYDQDTHPRTSLNH